MRIIHKLDEIVKQMLEEHEGGTIFFDNLDQAVQQKPLIESLLGLANEHCKDRHGIIVSGKFGRYFTNLIDMKNQLLVVNGGLRSGNPIDDISYLKLEGMKFIFLDDSFYSGKTRDVIKNELEKNGAKLVKTFVVYDGSKEKDESVYGLYRYYDNH